MINLVLVMGVAIVLGWPLGLYMAKVMRGGKAPLDKVFLPVEKVLYALIGPASSLRMRWKTYALSFLAANLVVGLVCWLQFMVQDRLPLNPDNAPGMNWHLALHTMVSFLTNTNQQHYSGQSQLSWLSQMVAIVGLQVVTPMFGLAMLVATLRAFFGGREVLDHGEVGIEGRDRDVGNFWQDVVRATVRLMLPLCLVASLMMAWQGVPATLTRGADVVPIDASAGMATQHIPVGPVASMVAAKQLGTNGGGWYGPNGAMALENPTPFSSFFNTVFLILIPIGCVAMIGPFTGRRRLSAFVFATMLGMSLASSVAMLALESHTATSAGPLVMEGKEVRLGVDASAVYGALTTQTSNGSVIGMHDSYAPLSGGVEMVNMLINGIWGGIGCGALQFFVYVLLAVFLAGLMTGRTPELFGRKIEAHEVRLLAGLILIQPLVILGFAAIALAVPSLAANSNPAHHGISQVLYEYMSAFANNGSGFEGLGDNTVWWNVTCSIVLLCGRLPALVFPLAIAASMARKRVAPEGAGTLHVETPTFALTLVSVVVILTVLQFMPALVLGPVADHLQLVAQGAIP